MKLFETPFERRVLFSIIVFGVGGYLGIDLHLASFPAIAEFFHTSQVHVQQSVAIYLFGMGVGTLFYGPISDAYGRKPVILFGLLFASFFSFGAVFTKTIHQFLFLRVLQGMGTGVCLGLGRTVAGDILEEKRYAVIMPFIASVGFLFVFLAPAIGGHLQEFFGWKANFIALGSYLAFAACFYELICPETLLKHAEIPFKLRLLLTNCVEVLKHRVFIATVISSGVVFSILMIYSTLSPFILQKGYGLTPVKYGWVTGCLGIAGFCAQFFSSFMIHRFGRTEHLKIVIFSLLGVASCFVFLDFLDFLSLYVLLFVMFISFFLRGSVSTIFTSYVMGAFSSKKGLVGSLYGSGQLLIAFAMSSLVGFFSKEALLVMACSYLGIALILLLMMKVLHKHKNKG